MKIFNTYFLKLGSKIIIANGKDPLRYFDLAKMRLHTYKPDKDPHYYKFVAGDEVGKVVRTKTKSTKEME